MKKITGYIQSYSRSARDKIVQIAADFLMQEGLKGLSTELFSCVDEVIKNAVKANYKFVLIKERISEKRAAENPGKTPAEIEQDILEMLKNQKEFDAAAKEVLAREDISARVREILNEESKLLTIKNNAYLAGRPISGEERKKLESLDLTNGIREKIKKQGIKIILKMQTDGDFIYIEVTNTAPILTEDMNRIHRKREEHQRYKDEEREHEFFIENLDTSESGFGLGYAKIDSILSNWGLDAQRAVTIISSINTTILLTLPIDDLKKE